MKLLEILCVICTVIVLLVILFILLVIVLKVHYGNQAAAIVRQKCDEYSKLSCDQSTSKKLSTSNDESSRVIGGWNVSDGILPHMVAIVIVNKGRCSGSIISEYFVMTAAHCVHNTKKNEVYSTLGSVNRSNGAVFKTDEIHVHPQYEDGTIKTGPFDIALLKLAKKVEFNWKTRPICLNTDFESISTANITVSGWGIDQNRDVIPEILRQVDTYIDGPMLTRCILRFGAYISSVMICAGHPTEHKSSCEGDSGGSLQIPLNNGCPNTYEEVGVTSGGTDHCSLEDGEPLLSIYTKVEFHITWIVSIVWPD